MPKIIENLPQRLVAEARRQIAELGYSTMTIRSVAKAVGVGVGTVYNYYPSKESLTAAFMLEDWRSCMEGVGACAASADSWEPVLRALYGALQQFIGLHETIFRDEAARAGFAGSFGRYHGLLRSQLAEPIRKFCPDEFTAEFAAEALLTWTVNGKSLDEICGVLRRLF